MDKKNYAEMVKRYSPDSKIFSNCLWAFFVGGTICLIGQIMTTIYMKMHFTISDARLMTSVSLVGLSAIFTALGWYHKIAKRAGAGTLVPITGFANAVVSPAIEFKSEGYITGVASKMFIIAGPVIVYGTLASVIYGVIYWMSRRF